VALLSGELPRKLFSRHERLSYSEITSCKCDDSQRWFALTGLTPQVISVYLLLTCNDTASIEVEGAGPVPVVGTFGASFWFYLTEVFQSQN